MIGRKKMHGMSEMINKIVGWEMSSVHFDWILKYCNDVILENTNENIFYYTNSSILTSSINRDPIC